MGDIFGDGEADEKPVHEVCINDFYISKFEVTVGVFRKFIDDTGYVTEAEKGNGCYFWGETKLKYKKSMNWRTPGFLQGDNHPVVCVSWNDAKAFIDWLSVSTGEKYRLPTEAEWEYAARSGGKKEKYAGFSNESQVYQYANICDKKCELELKIKTQDNGYKYTSPVGKYKPNGLGLCDMTGNVWEWVQDYYDEVFYKNSSMKNPKGPLDGELRVLRGGAWYIPAGVRSSDRVGANSERMGNDIGFRLVLSSH